MFCGPCELRINGSQLYKLFFVVVVVVVVAATLVTLFFFFSTVGKHELARTSYFAQEKLAQLKLETSIFCTSQLALGGQETAHSPSRSISCAPTTLPAANGKLSPETTVDNTTVFLGHLLACQMKTLLLSTCSVLGNLPHCETMDSGILQKICTSAYNFCT